MKIAVSALFAVLLVSGTQAVVTTEPVPAIPEEGTDPLALSQPVGASPATDNLGPEVEAPIYGLDGELVYPEDDTSGFKWRTGRDLVAEQKASPADAKWGQDKMAALMAGLSNPTGIKGPDRHRGMLKQKPNGETETTTETKPKSRFSNFFSKSKSNQD